MADRAVSLSDVKEDVWLHSIGAVITGVSLIIVAAILFYFTKFLPSDTMITVGRIALGVAMVSGAIICGIAVLNGALARKVQTVIIPCPYCGKENRFLEPPMVDYACEGCSRSVHYHLGMPVDVVTIVCQACRTEHRIPVSVQRYVCENCNRPVALTWVAKAAVASGGLDAAVDTDLLRNYDVMLVAFDRRHENDIAFKLQNLMLVNLNEARRLMATASTQSPLVVAFDQPQRKAEAIKRSLMEMGATATMRPTTSVSAPVGNRGY